MIRFSENDLARLLVAVPHVAAAAGLLVVIVAGDSSYPTQVGGGLMVALGAYVAGTLNERVRAGKSRRRIYDSDDAGPRVSIPWEAASWLAGFEWVTAPMGRSLEDLDREIDQTGSVPMWCPCCHHTGGGDDHDTDCVRARAIETLRAAMVRAKDAEDRRGAP